MPTWLNDRAFTFTSPSDEADLKVGGYIRLRSLLRMWSATRSACATIVSAGFTAADDGKNDASTTNRFSTSCARQNGSSTDVRGSVPKTIVPHWCVVFFE